MQIREILDLPRELLERFCEQKTQYAYLGNNQAIARVLGKYFMYVDTTDTSVAPHLILDGYWESWITKALLRIKPGTRCVDVGANHGYYTLVLAELCEAEVFAFEPQVHLAAMIRKSANVSGFRKTVTVFDAAVGANAGRVFLTTPRNEPTSLGAVWCEDTPIEGQEIGGATRLTTLDLEVPGQVGFIKIDAEGAEPQIWAGMKRHLENRPIILMEFSAHAYEDAGEFLNEIEKCYPLQEVDNEGDIVPVTREKLLENPEFSMLWLEVN